MTTMREAPWRHRFRAAQVTLPSWARDEPERCLYTSNANGRWEIYAWDRTADTHRQVTDRPEGTTLGRLDPSGDWIWWFDDDHGSEFGRWMVEPFAGGQPAAAAPELSNAYPAGLALGRRFAVIGSSGEGGSAIHLVRSGEAPRLLYAHRESAWVAGLSRDETLLCISHSEHGDSRHPALRVIDRDGKVVADLWDGPGRGLRVAGWSPVYGDQRLLVMHERADLPRPLTWEPLTGDVDEIEIELPGEISASWYPDSTGFLLVHEFHGLGSLHHLRLRSPWGRDLGNRTNPAGTILGAAVRPDGEVWYAWSASWQAPTVKTLSSTTELGAGLASLEALPKRREFPRAIVEQAPGGEQYFHFSANGIPIFIAYPNEESPTQVFASSSVEASTTARHHIASLRMEGVRRSPTAGAEIMQRLHPPAPFEIVRRRFPTIIWVHGGPTSHDRDQYSPRVQAWVDHGYAVVLVNYRGSTGYGRAWRDALEGNPGFTELEDIVTVRDWLVEQGIADPERLILAGGSWGGYLTLLGLGARPDRWSLGIAAVPVADYVAAFEDEMESLKAFDRALFGGSPAERPEFYHERSPISYADQIRVPVLILGGENDPRCPIRQIDNYLARLDALEKPHEVYRFNAGHGSLVIDETIRQTEVMLDFAARHLGTSAPA